MTYFGVLIGLIIMAAMVYLAVDKKSNLPTRIAALAALAVMIITIIICVVLIFTDNTVPVDPSILIVGAPQEDVKAGNDNFWVMLLIILILAVVFSVIAFITMKEHKKHQSNIAETSLHISQNIDF